METEPNNCKCSADCVGFFCPCNMGGWCGCDEDNGQGK